MNHVIRGQDISDTWKQSVVYLLQHQNSSYNLVAEIENPTKDDPVLRKELNNVLDSLRDQRVETVANTIFPAEFEIDPTNRPDFYNRFIRFYPQLRNIPENARGTYFGRLVCWGFENGSNFNQLEKTIEKLLQVRLGRNRIRVRYEIGIYDPMRDYDSDMGFPCLSFISVKIRGNSIDMTAIYRNQFFVQKAYGNYLGLGRLLEFMARHSGFEVGKLTCIATHAHLGNTNKESLLKIRELCASVEQMYLDF
ncbi:hypothetical protein [Brevibacillus sp. HD1.4A]|uniref:hypothetical protein n=1 Tax=Brevibacillus sp. HD1.4A TaxID=2738978 RepID=UPI00156A7922|nr:hypothetical protein [Brevibacillus sp. HD1.4A]NRQ56336.1 hypothetical protein [Brevibacillus sp. HD1.4A]